MSTFSSSALAGADRMASSKNGFFSSTQNMRVSVMVAPGRSAEALIASESPGALRSKGMSSRSRASALEASVPGVVRVLTYRDVPVNEYGIHIADQPVLVAEGDLVRCEGDRLAIVPNHICPVVNQLDAIVVVGADGSCSELAVDLREHLT